MAQFLIASLAWVFVILPVPAFVVFTLSALWDFLSGKRTPGDFLLNWAILGVYAFFFTGVALFGAGLLLLVTPDFASHWAAILIGVLVSVEITLRIWRHEINPGHSRADWQGQS